MLNFALTNRVTSYKHKMKVRSLMSRNTEKAHNLVLSKIRVNVGWKEKHINENRGIIENRQFKKWLNKTPI